MPPVGNYQGTGLVLPPPAKAGGVPPHLKAGQGGSPDPPLGSSPGAREADLLPGDDVYDLTMPYREIIHREEFVPSDSLVPEELTIDMKHFLRSYVDFLTDAFDLGDW